MYEERTNDDLKSARVGKLKRNLKRASITAKRLGLLLLVTIIISAVCIPSSVYCKEKTKPDLEIKKISKCGTGEQKIRIPGRSGRWYSIIGSSNERIFTVKIKNNTKKEKRNVRVKLFLYDKKEKSIGEESPRYLKGIYAHEGYLVEERILYPRKSVKLYFAVYKKVKYVKAELSCEGKLIDVETYPSSFPERLK